MHSTQAHFEVTPAQAEASTSCTGTGNESARRWQSSFFRCSQAACLRTWCGRDRSLRGSALQSVLGIGIGLGLRSLLYFAYLQFFAGQNWFIVIELAAFAILLAVTVRLERQRGHRILLSASGLSLDGSGRALVFIAGLVFLISLLSTANYLLRRQTGRLGCLDDVQPRRALRLPRPGALAAIFLAPDGSTLPRRLSTPAGTEHCRRLAGIWAGIRAAIPMIQSGLFSDRLRRTHVPPPWRA